MAKRTQLRYQNDRHHATVVKYDMHSAGDHRHHQGWWTLSISQPCGRSIVHAGGRRANPAVPVRPDRQEFCRVHQGVSTVKFEVINKRRWEVYLLPPEVARPFGEFTVRSGVNRQGVTFLWPGQASGADGKIMEWPSRLRGPRLAITRWCRGGEHEARRVAFVAPATSNPVARSRSRIVTRRLQDRFVTDLDHPLVSACRGLMNLPYRRIVAAISSSVRRPRRQRPRPVCMVAKELRTGKTWRVFRGEFGPVPPFPIGPDTLFVAFYASAELGCFRALGWPTPARILDLFTEFRDRTNGLPTLAGSGLVGALVYFGLDTIGAQVKDEMRDLVLGGGPWSEAQREAILDYCESDTVAA